MSHESDLSAYEKLRLENIRRNHEFLAGLGLAPLQPKVVKVEVAQPPPRKVAPKVKREESPDLLTHDKRRRSGRLSGHFIKEEMLEETTEEAKPPAEPVETESFYERISQESDQLDDFEFQAFVELRRWRLLRSRELMIAPYGLFNNRTFCDMIRRRRNDPTWATPEGVAGPVVSVKEEPGTDTTDNNSIKDIKVKIEPTEAVRSSPRKATVVKTEPVDQSTSPRKVLINTEAADSAVSAVSADSTDADVKLDVVYDPTLIDALTECFGIAEGKTRVGGYAWEALAVLNKRKVCALLEQSRTKQPKLEPVE